MRSSYRKIHEDQAQAFRRFRECLDSVGLITDYFLDNFSKGQRIKIVGVFAMAMYNRRVSGPSYDTLVDSSIKGAILYMAPAFRENGRQDPTKDDCKLGQLLSRKYRAFRNKDPTVVQQKGSTNMCVSRTIKEQTYQDKENDWTHWRVGSLLLEEIL